MVFEPIDLIWELLSAVVEVWSGKKPVAFLGCFIVIVATVILFMALAGWWN